MTKYLFKDIVIGEEGLLKGPFGSDLKHSLYVPKGVDTYKVYLQENILNRTLSAGTHFISKEYFERKMKRYEVKENDFIVTCDGTLGELYQLKNIKEKGIISSSLLRVTLNPEIVDYNYFYYLFLFKVKKELITQANNSVLKHLPGIKVIKNHSINLPDLKIQKQVGFILSKIDEKININKKINTELESLAKTLYDYWFLQFEFPNEEGKPYKSSGGKMLYNEQLRKEIPEGWEVLKVKDLLNVITGKQDSNFATINGAYKFFTCSSEVLNCDEYAFEGKAVLLAGNGDFNVKHYQGKFNAYQRTYVLIPKEEKYFGSIYLATEKLVKKFKAGSNGSIVKFITKGDVENIEILKPQNDNLLEQFNLILKFIEKNKEENEELTKLRDFLLPLLMNGQVTIQDAEQQVNNTISNVWNAEKLLRFAQWKQMQGYAARGEVDEDTLMKIFDAMDKDAKK